MAVLQELAATRSARREQLGASSQQTSENTPVSRLARSMRNFSGASLGLDGLNFGVLGPFAPSLKES